MMDLLVKEQAVCTGRYDEQRMKQWKVSSVLGENNKKSAMNF